MSDRQNVLSGGSSDQQRVLRGGLSDRQRVLRALEISRQENDPSCLIPEYRPFRRFAESLLHAHPCATMDSITIHVLSDNQLPCHYEEELSAEMAVVLVHERNPTRGLHILQMANETAQHRVVPTTAANGNDASLPIHIFSRPNLTEHLKLMGGAYDNIRRWTQNAWHEQVPPSTHHESTTAPIHTQPIESDERYTRTFLRIGEGTQTIQMHTTTNPQSLDGL